MSPIEAEHIHGRIEPCTKNINVIMDVCHPPTWMRMSGCRPLNMDDIGCRIQN